MLVIICRNVPWKPVWMHAFIDYHSVHHSSSRLHNLQCVYLLCFSSVEPKQNHIWMIFLWDESYRSSSSWRKPLVLRKGLHPYRPPGEHSVGETYNSKNTSTRCLCALNNSVQPVPKWFRTELDSLGWLQSWDELHSRLQEVFYARRIFVLISSVLDGRSNIYWA